MVLVIRDQISGRATRSAQLLNVPLCRTAAGQKSLRYRIRIRIATIGKSMDNDIKLCKNVKVFRKKFKKRLLKQYYKKKSIFPLSSFRFHRSF